MAKPPKPPKPPKSPPPEALPDVPHWMQTVLELPCVLRAIQDELAAVQAEQHKLHRTLQTLVAKEAHEAHILAAIQAALNGADLPPGKLEAVNTIIQANLAKLRGAIASVPPTSHS